MVGAADADEINDATAEASAGDPYLALEDLFDEVAEQVQTAIEDGDLDGAMALIEKNEPSFAGQWSVGRFGYAARMDLGDAYRRRGDISRAMELYRSARPGGGCGNCMAGQAIQRADSIARIYERKLNSPAAFVAYLSVVPDISLGGGAQIVFFGLLRSGAVCLGALFACWLLWRRVRSHRTRAGADSPAS